MRRGSRLAAICALVGLATIARADTTATPGIDPTIGKVEVIFNLPRDKPYVGEMIMLRMRSFIRADIALDQIRQPPLTNFDWQQLGRDKPIRAMVDGFDVAGVERDIAIFPQQAGRLIIEPFVRHVTLVMGDMRRVETDFASKPVFVDVQNTNAVAPPGSWWLPAKSLSLTDTWSQTPDEIKPGTLSRRTITLEAVGLTADRLPPVPDMRAAGTIAFKGPEKRETFVTDDGPVARATYIWEIRPVSSSPARLPAISVPWFDTGERHMRVAALPETWIAYVGTLVHPAHERVKSFADLYLAPGPLAMSAAGFAWTVAAAALVATRRRRSGRPPGERRRLSTLVRRARDLDEPGLRRALDDLARHAPRRWARVARDPRVASGLAALDTAQFSRQGGPAPELAPLARDVVAAWRSAGEADAADAAAAASLPPIDGSYERPMTWLDRLRRRQIGMKALLGSSRGASPASTKAAHRSPRW